MVKHLLPPSPALKNIPILFGIHSKSEKVCGTAFSVKKNVRKKCVNPGVNVSRQMRVNLAFKILPQKVRKSPRQYFATKVRKLRFQILKTEVCKSRHQAHRTKRVHIGKNISVIFSMINMEV